MKYIKKFEQVFTNKNNKLKRLLSFDLEWNKPRWKKIKMRGISVNIQPGFESNADLDKKINEYIDRILDLTSRYNLVYDSIDLFKIKDSRSIKFRVSDIPGNNKYGTGGEIPEDIKVDIIKDIRKTFNDAIIEEFEGRGYLHVVIDIKL